MGRCLWSWWLQPKRAQNIAGRVHPALPSRFPRRWAQATYADLTRQTVQHLTSDASDGRATCFRWNERHDTSDYARTRHGAARSNRRLVSDPPMMGRNYFLRRWEVRRAFSRVCDAPMTFAAVRVVEAVSTWCGVAYCPLNATHEQPARNWPRQPDPVNAPNPSRYTTRSSERGSSNMGAPGSAGSLHDPLASQRVGHFLRSANPAAHAAHSRKDAS